MTKVQTKTKGSPDDIDRNAGRRLLAARRIAGISQDALAQKVGVTFQQIQKYEKGYNRMSVGRVWQIAQILAVPVSYFFPDQPVHDEILAGYRKAQRAIKRIEKIRKIVAEQ